MREHDSKKSNLLGLSFASLGVVFGDLGTSPLYAFSAAVGNMAITTQNIYGVLSLIFWSLILLICCKYLFIVFRADNDGEGGIMALTGLINQKTHKKLNWLIFINFLGIGLLIGDGMLTPAISILSAVEGLKPLSPDLEQYVLPVTVILLFLLFWLQKIGTGKIGLIYAPAMLLWFMVIGYLGVLQILQNPQVLKAINPYYIVHLFIEHKYLAVLTMGGVFLVMTGGEALFADLGHFGKKPIIIAWFYVALPGLLLCYFGQGALLLAHPEKLDSLFYSLSPRWFLPSMIVLATLATIIASQAIISASFSIIKQASFLNYIPRFKVVFTSSIEKGQVYLPFVNFILLVGTCILVLSFKTSNNLTAAFGIAVNLYMIITSILVSYIAYKTWNWGFIKLSVFPLIFLVEFAFLSGNLPKIMNGGLVPILIAFIGIILMHIWSKGYERLKDFHHRDVLFNQFIMEELDQNKISKNAGICLYITDPYDEFGGSLLYHLRLSRMLSEIMVFISIKVGNKPNIPLENKFEFNKKAEGLYSLVIHYGFSEEVDLQKILMDMPTVIQIPFDFDKSKLRYFTETITLELIKNKDKKMWYWEKFIFATMLKNSASDIQFYNIPTDKTLSIGAYYQL